MDTAPPGAATRTSRRPTSWLRLLEAMHGPMSGPAKTGHYLLGEAIELLKKPKENASARGCTKAWPRRTSLRARRRPRRWAGIVFAKNRPYALCVMTTFLKDELRGNGRSRKISRRCLRVFQPSRRRRRPRPPERQVAS